MRRKKSRQRGVSKGLSLIACSHLHKLCLVLSLRGAKKVSNSRCICRRCALFPRNLFERFGIDIPRHLVRIGRPSSEPTPARLVGRYFPSLIPQSENKQLPTRRCFVSSQTEKKTNRTRHESRYECTICEVGLRVDPCFRIYHTLLKFWT